MQVQPISFSIPVAKGHPVDDENRCREALRACGWWGQTELVERWPMGTGDAAELLRAAGQFDIDHDHLVELVDRRLMPAPDVNEQDGYEWNAIDVLQALHLLETRMQWLPTPSAHDCKKHPNRIIREQAAQDLAIGDAIVGPHGERLDARHCLVHLVRAETLEERHKILELLLAVLEVEHGLKV